MASFSHQQRRSMSLIGSEHSGRGGWRETSPRGPRVIPSQPPLRGSPGPRVCVGYEPIPDQEEPPMTQQDKRPRSWEVTNGPERAPARAMLRAVGFSEEDFDKPQVGVASSWNEVTPCNYHLDKLAALAKEGVRQGDAVPIEFTTIAVSDGIAMGHEGMRA